MNDISVSEIARRLADHAEDLCRELLPNGRRDGSEWRCGSINGEAGGRRNNDNTHHDIGIPPTRADWPVGMRLVGRNPERTSAHNQPTR